MKIDEVIAYHKGRFDWYIATEGRDSMSAYMHLAISEALEQHHKDLMGLVAAWRVNNRDCGDPNVDVPYKCAQLDCADNLESLINPKD